VTPSRLRQTTLHPAWSVTDRLREEQRVSQKSHNGRRHALNLQKLEIEELKKALTDQGDMLQVTEAAQIRASATQAREREQGVMVATLEADLACVWRSAETLGRDLHAEWKRRKEENAWHDVEHKVERGRVCKEVEDLCICRICGYCVHVIFVF
jgi:hypothetical protein